MIIDYDISLPEFLAEILVSKGMMSLQLEGR